MITLAKINNILFNNDNENFAELKEFYYNVPIEVLGFEINLLEESPKFDLTLKFPDNTWIEYDDSDISKASYWLSPPLLLNKEIREDFFEEPLFYNKYYKYAQKYSSHLGKLLHYGIFPNREIPEVKAVYEIRNLQQSLENIKYSYTKEVCDYIYNTLKTNRIQLGINIPFKGENKDKLGIEYRVGTNNIPNIIAYLKELNLINDYHYNRLTEYFKNNNDARLSHMKLSFDKDKIKSSKIYIAYR